MQSLAQREFDFDGRTFIPSNDSLRLNKQLQAVFDVVKSGKWLTLAQLSALTQYPEASIQPAYVILGNRSLGVTAWNAGE